jgi:hypothetical protein
MGPVIALIAKILGVTVDSLSQCPETSNYTSEIVEEVIEFLDTVPGMTPCRTSLFLHSTPKFKLQDGSVIKTWTNRAVGGYHIFLADPEGKMLYGGFVWTHTSELKKAINEIKTQYRLTSAK